jgi:ribonuclease HI
MKLVSHSVLHNHGVVCVGAAAKLTQGSGTVELAETSGLREALALIDSNNLHHVDILMDAAGVVQAINNKIYPRSQWGQLARACSRVMEKLTGVTLTWIPSKENEAAHSLARWAKSEPNRFWTTNFPHCIQALICNNKANVT